MQNILHPYALCYISQYFMTSIVLSSPARLRGTIHVPGDKSISHRAVIFNAIAEGNAQITNFLTGADCLSTIACVQALGVEVSRHEDTVFVSGVGLRGLQEPQNVLDCGNSGTTLRLLSGLLAGRPLFAFPWRTDRRSGQWG
jgi:3-phosphoshikimate 1-carboxyvinyltransferase